MTRLSNAALAAIPISVAKPSYDRGKVTTGIVHLGIGAFHRAHQAVYVDNLLRDDPSWGIIGASLRSPDTASALNPQDGLYTVVVSGPDGRNARVIGSISRVLVCPADQDALLAEMSSPAVRIVSLTVTEKGYCHDPATGALNEAHPDIAHDLAHPERPRSAPGLLLAALRRRRAAGIPPFTVLCCDNLPDNGRVVQRVVSRLAELLDPALGRHLTESVAFPSTMVDRIVPATTDDDRASAAAALGVTDAWPVAAEPFSQWVIEDNFPTGRPAFERAGAQMVADVRPFEHMKLRMLNGSHSTLAYLGYLAGHETVAAAISDAPFRALLHALMTDEVMPALRMPAGVDLAAYRDALLVRFANPGLRHRTGQIAMDGSQKLPQRLLGTIRDRIAAGQPFDRLALAVAGWMRYVAGEDEQGQPIDVRDPMAARLAELASDWRSDPQAYVERLLSLEAVFGGDLSRDRSFAKVIQHHFGSLVSRGSRSAVAAATAAG